MLARALLQTSLLLWMAQQTLQGGLRPQTVAYGRMLPNRGVGHGVGVNPAVTGALGAVANRYNTKAMKAGLGRYTGAQLGVGGYRSLGVGGRTGLKPGYGAQGGYGASLGTGMMGPTLSNGHGLGLGLGQAGKRGYNGGLGAGLGGGLGGGLGTGLGAGYGAVPGGYGALGGMGIPGQTRQGLVGSPELGIQSGLHGAVKGLTNRRHNPYPLNPVRSNGQHPSTLEIHTDPANRQVVGDIRGLEMGQSRNMGTAIDKPGKSLDLAGQRRDYLPIDQGGVLTNQGMTNGRHLINHGMEKDLRNLPTQQHPRDISQMFPNQRQGKNCNKGVNDQLGIIQQSEMLRSQGLGSHGLGSQGMGSQGMGSQAMGSQGLGSQGLGSHGLGSHGLGLHGLGSQGMGSQGLGSHGLGSHGLGSQGMGSQGLGSQGMGTQGLGSQGMGSQGFGSQGLGSQFPIDKSSKYHGHSGVQTQGENSPLLLPDGLRSGVFSVSQGQNLPEDAIREMGLVGKSTDKLQPPHARISIGVESGHGASNLHIQGVEGNRQGLLPGVGTNGGGSMGGANANLGLVLAEEQKSINKEGKHPFHEGRDVREPKALPESTGDNTQGASYLGGQGNYLGVNQGAGGYGAGLGQGGYLGGAAGKMAAGYGDGMTGYLGAMGTNGYGGDVRGLAPGYANGYGDAYGAGRDLPADLTTVPDKKSKALGAGAFPGQLPGAGYGALGAGMESLNGKYGGAGQLPYGAAPVIQAGLEGEGGYPYSQTLGLEAEGVKSAKSYGDQVAKFNGGAAALVNGYKG